MFRKKKRNSVESDSSQTTNKKKIKAEKSTKRNANNVLMYDKMYRSGLCELGNNLFSRSVKFHDLNYEIASESEQMNVFEGYMQMLNSLGTEQGLSLTFTNKTIDEDAYRESVSIPYQNDGLDHHREELNRMLMEKISVGTKGLQTEKYFTFTTQEDTYDDAVKSLNQLSGQFVDSFKSIGTKAEIMDGHARLDAISNILYPGKRFEFNYDHMDGLTTRDALAPQFINFANSHQIEINDRFAKTYVMTNYSNELSDKLLSDLMKFEHNITVTFQMKVYDNASAVSLIKAKRALMESQIIDEQRKAIKRGYDPEMIPHELRYSYDEANILLEDVQQRNQRLFACQFIVLINCESEQEFKEVERKLLNLAKKNATELTALRYEQEKGLNAVLPLGITSFAPQTYRTLTTSVCGVLIPFSVQEINDGQGSLYYGLNAITKNLIMVNRFNLLNPSGWILGKPGSGKSFKSKVEMSLALLMDPNVQILVIDPQREYGHLARSLNGTVLYIDNKHDTRVNPLEIDVETTDIADKIQFIITLTSRIVGEKQITPRRLSLIDRVARRMYDEYVEKVLTKQRNRTHDVIPSPRYADFYHALKNEDTEDKDIKDLVESLELYVEGSNNIFAGESNVDIRSRFVVFDIHELAESMKSIGMLVILESIMKLVLENFKKGIKTLIYTDEIHMLFKDKYSVEFYNTFYKIVRKLNGAPTGMTQNVDELLRNDEVRSMISNSEFIIMMAQSETDRVVFESMFNISDSMSKYIENPDEGCGLLYIGGKLVPFEDKFPKDVELYKYMTTKPEERKEYGLL